MSKHTHHPDPTGLAMREDALHWWTELAITASAHSGYHDTPLTFDE